MLDRFTQVHALRRKRIMWRGLRAFQQSCERERLRKWVALCKLARSALSIDFVLRTMKYVRRIRSSSRVTVAVVTLQRKFREKRLVDEESKIKNYALLVQRCSRLFLLRRELSRRRANVDIVKVYRSSRLT